MKLWKSSILFVSVAVMLLSSMAVSADKTESDPTGDVAHWEYTTGQWGWNYNIGNKPNIDITELSYFMSGPQLTLILKVVGTIQSSELNWYWVYLNTSDATYWMSWMEGEGGGMAMNIEEGSMQWDLEPEITVSGNTLSCTFDVVGSDYSNAELWGYSTEYVEAGDMNSEWWGDWAPETHSPFWGEGGDDDDGGDGDDNDGGDGDDNDGGSSGSSGSSGTPGLEAIAVLAAVGISLIILRRRK